MSDKLKTLVFGNPMSESPFVKTYREVLDSRIKQRGLGFVFNDDDLFTNNINAQYGSIKQCQRAILTDPLLQQLKQILIEMEMNKPCVVIATGSYFINPETAWGDEMTKALHQDIMTKISDREKQIMNHFGLEVPNHEPDKTQKVTQGK